MIQGVLTDSVPPSVALENDQQLSMGHQVTVHTDMHFKSSRGLYHESCMSMLFPLTGKVSGCGLSHCLPSKNLVGRDTRDRLPSKHHLGNWSTAALSIQP